MKRLHRRLTLAFFRRSPLTVARALIGKVLVRRLDDGTKIAGVIVETEAYLGMEDLASHARYGRTVRNAPMFGSGGRWYVYFIYGVHWMLNAITGTLGKPSGVLIRSVAGVSGPARMTRFFGIDRAHNDARISHAAGLWIEDRGIRVPPSIVVRGPRIGVAYAGSWARKPYRFYVTDKKFLNTYVSLPFNATASRNQGRSTRRRRV